MDEWPYVAIGRVVKSHGKAGELAIMPFGELLEHVAEGTRLWFVPPPESAPRSGELAGVRSGPKGPLLAVAGIEGPETARALTGAVVLAARADLPADLPPEETSDIGLTVSDAAHGDLGTVTDVIVTGANDVWVVDGPLGEVLIPVIDDVVLDIDREAGAARVELLPGLLPGEGEA